MYLHKIDLTNLLKDKKIKSINCLITEDNPLSSVIKHLEKEYEFDTGNFIIELEDGTLLEFTNSEWGFAKYYDNFEQLQKENK